MITGLPTSIKIQQLSSKLIKKYKILIKNVIGSSVQFTVSSEKDKGSVFSQAQSMMQSIWLMIPFFLRCKPGIQPRYADLDPFLQQAFINLYQINNFFFVMST